MSSCKGTRRRIVHGVMLLLLHGLSMIMFNIDERFECEVEWFDGLSRHSGPYDSGGIQVIVV